ncbi:MAG: diacylglycerol kinase family protein, partial [Planctomycetia bacterium]|nr:diacylglycerol kinase family protein [Planctomycetia bacterium]
PLLPFQGYKQESPDVTENTPYFLPEDRKHVILSVNPKAGRRNSQSRVQRLEAALQKEGLTVETMTDLQQVAEKANLWFEERKLRALIGIGGDGTAAELTNRTVPGVPIALLPSGTANLLAKHFRYSFQPEKFARMILQGKVLTIDAARANGRIFLAMIGSGFDADVVEQVHQARMAHPKHAHINYFSYTKPILHSILHYPFPRVQLEILDAEGKVLETLHDSHWLFISNIPKYGWGVPITPKAVPNDGVMDVCLWRGGSLASGLFLTVTAQCGIHPWFSRCHMRTGNRFRISLAPGQKEVPVPYQLDGDPGGNLPVEVEVLPRRLTIYVR